MSTPIFNLNSEYDSSVNASDKDDSTDDISYAPYWIMVVVRLNKPLSYSRSEAKSVGDFSSGIQRQGDDDVIVITHDCINLSISRPKESHIKTLSATLVQGETNYLTDILPGDWVMSWIVHDRAKYNEILKNIKNNNPANDADSGLKFVGRVHSIRKHLALEGDGKKTVRYQLQCFGFREFDSQYFYSQYLSDDSDLAHNIGLSLAKIGLKLKDLVANEGRIDKIDNVHIIIPVLMDILLNTGLQNINYPQSGVPQQAFGLGANSTTDVNAGKQAPYGYLVPFTIIRLLNGNVDTHRIASYLSVFQVLTGLQKYTFQEVQGKYASFCPKIAILDKLTKGVVRYTGNPLLGAFLVLPPAYDNRPIWDILSQFLNPMLNEMYTCLRVSQFGSIQPTVVLRQIPFSTAAFHKRVQDQKLPLQVTEFMSLPRWVLPSSMVRSVDLGRHDASRTNFVWLLGQEPGSEANLAFPKQGGLNPPVLDNYDIAKNGLRSNIEVVNVNILNQQGKNARYWSELIADREIGSHLNLNGTIQSIGIQSPICEGDNLQFEGIVYHIEGIADHCSLDTNSGTRTWSTTLTVSHGLVADDEGTRSDTDEGNSLFPGFKDEADTQAVVKELRGTTPVDDNVSTIKTLDPGTSDDDEDQ